MTLFDLAKDNLSVEELEAILEEKKAISNPKPLTEIEKIDQFHDAYLSKILFPPIYK